MSLFSQIVLAIIKLRASSIAGYRIIIHLSALRWLVISFIGEVWFIIFLDAVVWKIMGLPRTTVVRPSSFRVYGTVTALTICRSKVIVIYCPFCAWKNLLKENCNHSDVVSTFLFSFETGDLECVLDATICTTKTLYDYLNKNPTMRSLYVQSPCSINSPK